MNWRRLPAFARPESARSSRAAALRYLMKLNSAFWGARRASAEGDRD